MPIYAHVFARHHIIIWRSLKGSEHATKMISSLEDVPAVGHLLFLNRGYTKKIYFLYMPLVTFTEVKITPCLSFGGGSCSQLQLRVLKGCIIVSSRRVVWCYQMRFSITLLMTFRATAAECSLKPRNRRRGLEWRVARAPMLSRGICSVNAGPADSATRTCAGSRLFIAVASVEAYFEQP